MRVELPYGPGRIAVEVPEASEVIRPIELPGLEDPAAAITAGLRRPLSGRPLTELVRPGMRVAVVFPDITRPMPNKVVLPALLAELARLGAGPEEVTLLCATGTHRSATAAELDELIGEQLVERYRIHQHVASDDDGHVEVGEVDGTPILLDRRYVEAELRLVTGFVEPHFFAGYSGGPKAVCPGLAGLDTILEAHSPRRILSPVATWTELDANPVHRFVTQAVELMPPELSIDVTINGDRELTGVFVGSLPDAHREACEFVRRSAVQLVPVAVDIVVASNAGLPLDRNLYQAVKGMAAAERVVREGGDIVLVASCVDGFPEEGPFAGILRSASSADALIDPELATGQDSWQAQVLGRVLAKADVHLFTGGLSAEQLRAVHLFPVADPSDTVAELVARRGPGATVCVLPEGPLSVVTVAS